MTHPPLDSAIELAIEGLVQHYVLNLDKYKIFLNGMRVLAEVSPLSTLIHSSKSRLKDPEHLRDKLRRKVAKALKDGVEFDIRPDNLFERINDLAGLRILHLHTRQMEQIHKDLLAALEEARLPLVEAPFARTWDDESRAYFASVGIRSRDSDSMYTSVHYVIEANTRTKLTGEIQVRTLAEELWGEVDHSINYPHATPLVACQEQIRVLARVTSSCSRLVDAIFTTHAVGIQRAQAAYTSATPDAAPAQAG
jgi:ppGpp synthetase/RelA/SpoT-type nucleotidyltranferase